MKKYKRIGRCQPEKCGAFCCRIHPFIALLSDKEYKKNKQYYQGMGLIQIGNIKQRNPSGDRRKFHDNKYYTTLTPCKNLKNLRCSIHKKRDAVCREFPAHPDQSWFKIAKQHGCTYDFVEVEK